MPVRQAFTIVTFALVASACTTSAGLADGPATDPAPRTSQALTATGGAALCAELRDTLGGLCPDITEEAPRHLGIQRAQKREWLRFSSTHWNEGPGKLQIHGGNQTGSCQVEEAGTLIDTVCTFATQEILDAAGQVVYSSPAGVALYHPTHHHWHQDKVADFKIHAGSVDGPVLGEATKVTYCLIDFDAPTGLTSEKTYIDCNADLQGISPGFGDEYHHSTEGQEIEITTMPAGVYFITHEADPSNKWLESSDSNNTSWTKFEITRDSGSGNANLTVLEESACTGLACGNTSNR